MSNLHLREEYVSDGVLLNACQQMSESVHKALLKVGVVPVLLFSYQHMVHI